MHTCFISSKHLEIFGKWGQRFALMYTNDKWGKTSDIQVLFILKSKTCFVIVRQDLTMIDGFFGKI